MLDFDPKQIESKQDAEDRYWAWRKEMRRAEQDLERRLYAAMGIPAEYLNPGVQR